MGTTVSTSVQLKSDIELMCEVLALDKLYPSPPQPPLPPPEDLATLEWVVCGDDENVVPIVLCYLVFFIFKQTPKPNNNML